MKQNWIFAFACLVVFTVVGMPRQAVGGEKDLENTDDACYYSVDEGKELIKAAMVTPQLTASQIALMDSDLYRELRRGVDLDRASVEQTTRDQGLTFALMNTCPEPQLAEIHRELCEYVRKENIAKTTLAAQLRLNVNTRFILLAQEFQRTNLTPAALLRMDFEKLMSNPDARALKFSYLILSEINLVILDYLELFQHCP